MRTRRRSTGIILFVLLIVSLFLLGSVMAKGLPKFVYIATPPQGSVYYSFAGIFAKIVDEHSGMSGRVQALAGSSAYIPAISQGKIEFGINNANDIRLAALGEKPFIKSPNIRIATVMCPLLVGICVRNNSDIKTIQDLKGKRVAAKYPAQLALALNVETIMASAGMTWEDVKEVPVTNSPAGIQALIEGRVDAAAFAIMGAAVKEADATIPGGLRFLPVVDTPEGAKGMAKVWPGSYPSMVKGGAPGTVGIKQDQPMMAYDIVLSTGSTIDNDVVYAVVKTLYEHEDAVRKGHNMLARFARDKMAKPNATVPYHDGAIKFYKEAGLWSAEMEKVQQELLKGFAG